jgi:O-antigen/teichoic acid export membrane protein
MSLMKQAAPLFAARGFSAVLTFLIPVFVARHLSRADYGTYKQFFLVASTAVLVGQIGLPASLYYFMPREPDARGRYLIQALVGLLVVGGVAAWIVRATAGASPALAPLAKPLALYLWAYLGAVPLEISLTSMGKTGWSGVTIVTSDVVRTAALIGPILVGAGLPMIAWAAAAFAVVRLCAAWTLALSGRACAPRPPTRASLRRQLGYALPFAGAVLLATAQMQLPQYTVAALTDTATFALFAVGVLQLPLTDMLYTPVAEVMMVRLAHTDRAGAPAVFREAVAKLVPFFLPLCAFVLAVARDMVPTLYGTAYAASVPIAMLCVCEAPLSSLPVDGLLRAMDRTRKLFMINAGRLAFTAALVPLGLVTFGLPGAMLGYVVTQWLAKLTMLVVAARELGVTPRALLPVREVVRWAARAACIAGTIELVRAFTPWHGVGFLVGAGATAAALMALFLWTSMLAPRTRPAQAEEVTLGSG